MTHRTDPILDPIDVESQLRRRLESLARRAAAESADYERRLARAIEERDRALATLDAKTHALACLSHELRTPMNGILGMTRIVLDSELTARQRECLEVVGQSADQLLTLVNDVLDLSKLGAGKLALETIPFDLRDALSTAISGLEPLASAKGLEIEATACDDVPTRLLGDPTRLRQVLLNLTANAVKFTEAGRIELSVAVRARTEERIELLFRVADEGIGIPADRIDSLFEPYSQAALSTSRQYGGTGLGLAICRDLVDLMGGRIWLESTEGVGSQFFFTACFALRPPQPRPAPQDTPADLLAYLLAAEPSAGDLARQAAQICRRTFLFDRPEALLQAGREQRPDIAVIDLDHYSLEVVAALDSEVRTLVVASSGQRGDAAHCAAAGAAAYLTRPLGPLDLRDAVRAVLAWDGGAPITRHWLRERRHESTILAVDDDAANRKVLTMMLEAEGYTVVTAADGQDALAVFRSQTVDLMLIDLNMPVLGGIEAAQALRRSGAETPIFALTGHVSSEQIEACLAAGMNGHLAKPFRFDELIEVVAQGLDARRDHGAPAAA